MGAPDLPPPGLAAQWGKIGHGGCGLVGVTGGQDDAYAAAQLIQVEPAEGRVLAEQAGQALAVGVAQQPARRPRSWARHH